MKSVVLYKIVLLEKLLQLYIMVDHSLHVEDTNIDSHNEYSIVTIMVTMVTVTTVIATIVTMVTVTTVIATIVTMVTVTTVIAAIVTMVTVTTAIATIVTMVTVTTVIVTIVTMVTVTTVIDTDTITDEFYTSPGTKQSETEGVYSASKHHLYRHPTYEDG